VVPLLLSAAALVLALGGVAVFAGELWAFSTAWVPVLAAGAWWTWLWIGPAQLLLGLLGALAFAALAGALTVGALLVANLAASPFLDALSRRVEALVAGGAGEPEAGWLDALRGGGRAVLDELRRLGFFLALQLGILGVGAVVPGAQFLAPPAMTLATLLFLPLDSAGPALDRRRLRFRDKRRWVLEHPGLMLGYGAAAFLACLVPGLNLLAMPVLVAGGTLLALRHPPATRDRAGARGTATSP
jgi:CysZ protein